MKAKSSNQGFTLLEALVSAVVFSIAVAGVFNAVSAIKEPATVSDERLGAALYGKQILENLRGRVDQRTWTTGNLTTGNHALPAQGIYSASYLVEENDAQWGAARKVTVTITWPD